MEPISRSPRSSTAKRVIRVVAYAVAAIGLSLLTVEVARFLYWTLPLPLFHIGRPSRSFDPERHRRLVTYLPGLAMTVLGWILVVWTRRPDSSR